MGALNGLNWTEQQARMVGGVIAEEVAKARLNDKFIPEFELEEDARTVRADLFDPKQKRVDDVTTIPLEELEEEISLTRLQTRDSDLSAAMQAIRRAANILARRDDEHVFGKLSKKPVKVPPGKLVETIAKELVTLEGQGYVGPYVLILGQDLFADANTPGTTTTVLPRDRLERLIGGGPIYRSSAVGSDAGLLLSLGGAPMDRAVAVAPTFEFLFVENTGKPPPNRWLYKCRVFERFAFRLKEKDSFIRLEK